MELIQIRIELNPADDPIGGRLHDPRDCRHEFHGWLQLISLLEVIRADGQPHQHQPRSDR